MTGRSTRLLKNAHLLRCPAASPSRRRGKESLLIRRDATLILPRVKHGAGLLRSTFKYASLLRISGTLHLDIFEQPAKDDFFSNLLITNTINEVLKRVQHDKKRYVIPNLFRNLEWRMKIN